MELRVGIITVSDSCSEGKGTDTSGPRLRELIEEIFSNVAEIQVLIIPDDLSKIESTLAYFADVLNMNLIFTTGGTGFAKRDVTPEATKKVIHKEAPQLSLAMSLCSFQKTKFAALSRAVCGIRNQSLIINLPGSKKAVEECFGSISDIIPHAIDLISDDSAKVRHVHKNVQEIKDSKPEKLSSSKHKHICPHKTGTGAAGDRNSPFPMISVDDALKTVLDRITFVQKFEKVCSLVNIPSFRASIKDGYAVKAKGGKGLKRVIAYVSAGDSILNMDFADDECLKINTGAPVPDFADAIIQVEDTKLIESSNGVESWAEILIDPVENMDIRPVGTDLEVGEEVFKSRSFPGIVSHKSLLASIGQTCEATPHDKVSVCVISTGDELTEPGKPLQSGRIYDSNSTMLMALLKNYGFENTKSVIVKDTFSALQEAINANQSDSKFIICSGSVSMGDKDFVKPVLKDLEYDIHFGRVNIKPGKPMTFASNQNNLLFGLPGNPVSAFVTFHLFVLPALRKCCGYNEHKLSLPYVFVELLNDSLELDPRPEYVRASVMMKNGKFYGYVTDNQISSRLQSIEAADVLLQLPGETADKKFVEAGEMLKAIILRQHFVSKYE